MDGLHEVMSLLYAVRLYIELAERNLYILFIAFIYDL